MPRIQEDRPACIVIRRDDLEIVIGDGNDFSWDEIDTLREWMRRWNAFHKLQVKQLSLEMLRGVLMVKRVFSGALMEDPLIWNTNDSSRRKPSQTTHQDFLQEEI